MTLLSLVLGVACAAPPAPPPVPAASPVPAAGPDCEAVLRDLRGAWGLIHSAAEPGPPTRRFLDGWPKAPPECRTGAWYTLAARRLHTAPGPLVADGVTFADAKQALDAGLAAAPADGGLLAYVAFGSGAAPDAFPALPADACARIAPGDDKAYVCGTVALRERQFDAALNHLAAIHDLAAYPDGAAKLRDARAGAGLPPLPAAPVDPVRCAKFGATPAECAAYLR